MNDDGHTALEKKKTDLRLLVPKHERMSASHEKAVFAPQTSMQRWMEQPEPMTSVPDAS